MRTPLIPTLALAGTTLLGGGILSAGNSLNAPSALLLNGTVSASPVLQDSDTTVRLGKKGGGRTWRGSIGDMIEVKYSQRGTDKIFTGRLETYREISRTLATMTVVGSSKGEGQVKRTFVVGDVISITTVGQSSGSDSSKTPSKTPDSGKTEVVETSKTPAPIMGDGGFPNHPGPEYDHLPRIFLLPIQGGVGDGTRHDEMKKIGEIADSYGPGQIIVLKVDSPGGLVAEADLIHETLVDLKLRHRLIAWIEEAISAAAYTSFHCNEIYFMKAGALGSATMFAGGKAIEGEQLRQWVKKFGDVAEESGHPRAIAEAMITNSKMVSYDPADGENDPKVYNTTEGQKILSTEEENLTIGATDAVACGFADGIADNEHELAEQLRLPMWYETTTDGRRIHERHQKLLETAKVEVPRLIMKAQGQIGQTNDALKNANRQLAAVNQLISWARRLGTHTSMMMSVPPLEALEQIKKTLQEQIRQLKSN